MMIVIYEIKYKNSSRKPDVETVDLVESRKIKGDDLTLLNIESNHPNPLSRNSQEHLKCMFFSFSNDHNYTIYYSEKLQKQKFLFRCSTVLELLV